jgi:IS5 family transposase
MGCHRTLAATAGASPERRATADSGSSRFDRHSVRADDWHALGDAAARDGLWIGNDLLAPTSRLAESGSLGSPPPSLPGSAGPNRSHRLEQSLYRRLFSARSRGGEKTGKNPTDRGKQGSKRHLVVDLEGIPLAILLTAANVNETTMLEATLDAIKPIKRQRGRPRKRPNKLHADKGYQSKKNKAALRKRGIQPRIARKGVESKQRLGRYRWVVERTHSWLNRFRRLKVRYERRADIHEAFLKIGCALICWNFLQQRLC